NSRAFDMMEQMSQPCSPQEMAEHWLHFMRPSFETALHGYRRINDGLARSFFAAAEGFTHTLAVAAANPEPAAKPAVAAAAEPVKAARVAAVQPVKAAVAAATEPVRKSA